MTDIKDVIHFYLGSEVEFIKDHSAYEKGDTTILTFLMLFALGGNEDKFRLRLRPLSSMTEEEMIECGFPVDMLDYLGYEETLKIISGENRQFTPEQFLWLLKNQFDLWNLIESNQAIDKLK